MPQSTVFVYTMNRVGQVGAWSRYVFPFQIKYSAQLENTLYLRDDNATWKMNKDINWDDMPNGTPTPSKRYYDGIVQWPWLDIGSSQDAMMEGFDIVGKGVPTVQFGYDQVNPAAFTDEYEVDPDTLTGYPIPMPLSAPSISPKITYKGGVGNFWQLKALVLYL